jgi:hypothetical protein
VVCEHAADGEADGGVDDSSVRAQLRGRVVDGQHRVLAVLAEDGGEGPQPGRARQLAGLVAQRDPLVVLQHQEDRALDADLLRVGGGQPVERVLGVRTEGAEPSGEMRLTVLQAPEVGGEAREVAPGGAVMALA